MRVARFPGWTHLLAAAALPTLFIGGEAHAFGIDTHDWWPRDNGSLVVGIVTVSLAVLLPAVALEAVLVLRIQQRWAARTVVIGYALIAGCICFFLASFRLAGGTTPARGDLVAAGLAAFILVMAGQALVTYGICQWWLRRAANSPQPL